MQVIKVSTDEQVCIVDVDFENMDTIYSEIGGFEIVRTSILNNFFNENVVMIVDDNGFAHGKEINGLASAFYTGDIVGDVLFVCEEYGEFVEFFDIQEICDVLEILSDY